MAKGTKNQKLPSQGGKSLEREKGWFDTTAKVIKNIGLIALSLISVLLLICIGKEIFAKNSLVVESFALPKEVLDAGIGPQNINNRLKDSLQAILASNSLKEVNREKINLRENISVPDITIESTHLSLEGLAQYLKMEILNIHNETYISGEIFRQDNQLLGRVYVDKDPSARIPSKTFFVPSEGKTSEEVDKILRSIAEYTVEKTDPFSLFIYLYSIGSRDQEARDVAMEAIGQTQDLKEKAMVYGFLGRMDYQRDRANTLYYFTKSVELVDKYNVKNASFAYTNLAWYYIQTRDFEKAQSYCVKALRNDPKDATAYNNYAVAVMGGKLNGADNSVYDQAVSLYSKCINLNPDEWRSQFDLAELHALKGEYAKSQTLCNEILEKNPANPDAYYLLGYISEKKGDEQKAEDFYTQGFIQDNKVTQAMGPYFLAKVCEDVGDSKAAIVNYELAIKLDAKYEPPYLRLSEIFQAEGRTVDAGLIDKLHQKMFPMPQKGRLPAASPKLSKT